MLARRTALAALLFTAAGITKAADLPQGVRNFPHETGMIDVKEAYGAAGDGRTDDTAAIRKAVQENLQDHRTLYFPPGTYLVSEMVEWRPGPDKPFQAFLTWQGAGTDRTTIRLKDNCPGFGDPAEARPIVRPGSIGVGDKKKGGGNRAHNNYLFDMTFHTGSGNPGAVGVDFAASNTGAMVDVRIVSGDGRGHAGLDLTREVGPCLIKRVRVEGFDIGIKCAAALYGIALEHIHLEGQNVCGLQNRGQTLGIRKLTSVNRVPALQVKGHVTVLVDSELRGGDAGRAAMELEGSCLVRNVTTSGYGKAIACGEQTVEGPTVEEWTSKEPVMLFETAPRSLNLPVEETPEFVDNDLSQWANVQDFGAVSRDGKDDSLAIQGAIDSGKTTVYFPKGYYDFAKPVLVRGRVRRIIGFQSWLPKDVVCFRFVDRLGPATFERFNGDGVIEIAGPKPVAVMHKMGGTVRFLPRGRTLFIENAVVDRLDIRPGQAVYARSLNIEKPPPEPMVRNTGGTFWALCYKTEFGNTVCETQAGGRSEVLGGLFYAAQGVKDKSIPLLKVRDASLSASYNDIAFYKGGMYQIELEEGQGGTTRRFTREDLSKGTWVVQALMVARPR